jgi:hypothetical protein
LPTRNTRSATLDCLKVNAADSLSRIQCPPTITNTSWFRTCSVTWWLETCAEKTRGTGMRPKGSGRIPCVNQLLQRSKASCTAVETVA